MEHNGEGLPEAARVERGAGPQRACKPPVPLPGRRQWGTGRPKVGRQASAGAVWPAAVMVQAMLWRAAT